MIALQRVYDLGEVDWVDVIDNELEEHGLTRHALMQHCSAEGVSSSAFYRFMNRESDIRSASLLAIMRALGGVIRMVGCPEWVVEMEAAG